MQGKEAIVGLPELRGIEVDRAATIHYPRGRAFRNAGSATGATA